MTAASFPAALPSRRAAPLSRLDSGSASCVRAATCTFFHPLPPRSRVDTVSLALGVAPSRFVASAGASILLRKGKPGRRQVRLRCGGDSRFRPGKQPKAGCEGQVAEVAGGRGYGCPPRPDRSKDTVKGRRCAKQVCRCVSEAASTGGGSGTCSTGAPPVAPPRESAKRRSPALSEWCVRCVQVSCALWERGR